MHELFDQHNWSDKDKTLRHPDSLSDDLEQDLASATAFNPLIKAYETDRESRIGNDVEAYLQSREMHPG